MTVDAIFLGSKAFGLSILDVLRKAIPSIRWSVLHPNDDVDTRSNLIEFALYCDENQIPFNAVSAAEANRIIDVQQPTYVFVCGWYWIIPNKLLESKAMFLGIHNSLLPKLRGGAPLVWALLADHDNAGSSLFELTPGMDDGPIVHQIEVSIGPSDDIASLTERLSTTWQAELGSVWCELVSGARTPVVQKTEGVTYCGQRIPDDGLIDWSWNSKRVHNFVRAQSRPYPGAFTYRGSEKVRIWKTALHSVTYHCTPGQILERGKGRLLVGCGQDSAIEIVAAEDAVGNTNLKEIFLTLNERLGTKTD